METITQRKSLNYTQAKNQIADWLQAYAFKSKTKGYIIGVSGGIDSAVCSTLCAMSGMQLIVVRMSIHQAMDQADRGAKHIEWLKSNFPNVKSLDIDLTEAYDKEIELLKKAGAFDGISADDEFLTSANTRSRLRMVTLYGVGGAHKLLVCGTGNKVEDYGVGFFTKYGDGGIDVSPIGELTKTEVYALGKELGIIQEILDARPTDGLWDDGRTDEDQIGATYPELEWAMEFCDKNVPIGLLSDLERTGELHGEFFAPLSERQKEVIKIYWKRHTANAHKMAMPPICSLSNLRD
jgi:NAD+ synthase